MCVFELCACVSVCVRCACVGGGSSYCCWFFTLLCGFMTEKSHLTRPEPAPSSLA